MKQEAIIRKRVPSDSENIAALSMQVWLHTYATDGISSAISRYVLSEFSAEKFAAMVSEERCMVLVAEIDCNLVGYALIRVDATCSPARSTVEIATLYVQEHFARMGR